LDLIFADGSINMLPPSRQKGFLEKVHQMLRPGGIGLMRIHVVTPPAFSTPLAVFKWYRTNCPHEPVFSATRTHLDMIWINREIMGINFVDYHEKIKHLHENQIITDHEFQAYNMLLNYNKINLYYIERYKFEEWCKDKFSIIDVLYGNDYPCSINHPIYVLRKLS
jgi:hypothetical protein